MNLTSPRKVLWLAVASCAALVFLLLLLRARPQPRTLDLRIAGQPQMTNGAMLITCVLSNGSSRSFNIVDDASGAPFFVLDAGRSNVPGTVGFGFGVLANTLKLNLAPGAAMTNAVRLTNPPSRFRLCVEVRDPGTECLKGVAELFQLIAVKAKLRKQATNYDSYITLPASAWFEDGKYQQ